MSGFFIVLIISIPVFYILGVMAFIDLLRGKKSAGRAPSDRNDVISLVLTELRKKHAEHPNASVSQLIAAFDSELNPLEEESAAPAHSNETVTIQPRADADMWANWYAENSINLILYIGAFLIVAAASVMVGFSWQSYDGITKSLLLVAASGVFLIGGFILHRIPKVKSAGTVFSAIGTLLIPFVGFGWYNFVFAASGVPFGQVWILTSGIMLAVAAVQSFVIQAPVFTYIASLGTVSGVLALQNTTGFAQEYYVIGAQASALVLLLVKSLIPAGQKKTAELYSVPLAVSGNIISPVSLLYFLYTALTGNTVFTVATGAGVLLCAGYYLFDYAFTGEAQWLVAAEILAPFGIMFVLRGYRTDISTSYFIIGILSIVYWIISYLFGTFQKTDERDTTGFLSLMVSIGVYYFATINGQVSAEIRTTLAFLPAAVAGLNALHTSTTGYLLPLSLFWAVFSSEFFHLNAITSTAYRGIWYLVTAEVWYLIARYLRPMKDQSIQLELLSSFLYFAAATLIIGNDPQAGYVVAGTITLTLLHSAWFTKSDKAWIFGVLAMYWFVWELMQVLGISGVYLPFVYTGLSVCIYAAGMMLPDPWRYPTRLASYIGIIAGSFGVFEGSPLQLLTVYGRPSLPLLQTYGLWNAYAATLFFIADMLLRTSKRMPYLVSLSAVGALSWQLWQMDVTNGLVYACIWGVYFSALGFVRALASDISRGQILDVIGIFLLIIPALNKSFEENGAMGAMTLGASGIGMFLTGIARNQTNYSYAGIFAIAAAVLSQTYQYILGLEKWIVIGILGLLFLAFATYLLTRRKSPDA